MKMLTRIPIRPMKIIEVGCGAGEILNQLHQKIEDQTIEFIGYDISEDAIKFCLPKVKDRLTFEQADFLKLEESADVLLMIDVFEHVEDYIGFIRKAAGKATYKIYHIPLELTVSNLLRNNLNYSREKVGHLHYFNKATAIATIEETGQEIIDSFYTGSAIHRSKRWRTNLMNIPRQLIFEWHKDFAVRLLGGYSLMVLAK